MTEPSSPTTPGPTISVDATAPGGSGLAQVLVALDLEWVADDLAAIVLDRVPAGFGTTPIQLRVVTDLGVLDDIAVLRRFDDQLRQLRRDLDTFCGDGTGAGRRAALETTAAASPTAPAAATVGGGPTAGNGTARAAATALAEDALSGVAGDLAGPAISAVAQLIDGHLQFAGSAVPVANAGVDLLFAHALARADPAPRQVVVDRLQPPTTGRVQRALDALLAAAAGPLARHRLDAEIAADQARAGAQADLELIGQLDQQILKLTDPAEPPALAGLRAQRAALLAARPERLAVVAATAARAEAGRAVAAAVAAFATSVRATGRDGVPALITRAAHGEVLAQPGLLLCYARLLAAGVDEVTGGNLLTTRWGTLAGACVEYAVVDANGATWAAGVRSVLQAAASRGHGALTSLDRQRLYPPSEPGPGGR